MKKYCLIDENIEIIEGICPSCNKQMKYNSYDLTVYKPDNDIDGYDETFDASFYKCDGCGNMYISTY